MQVLILASALWLVAALPAHAQQQGGGPQPVDTVLVEGNERVEDGSVLAAFGVAPGQDVTYREIQRGIKNLHSTQQFARVRVRAEDAGGPVILVVEVEERPLVRTVTITGLQNASERDVRDTTDLRGGLPYNRQKVLDAQAFIRGELAARGIPFAEIQERQEQVSGQSNQIDLYLDVNEGQRVTIAEVDFQGNESVADGVLRAAMSTKPEGFFWFRSGSYDELRYEQDLENSIPAEYRSRGFLDMEVVNDTLVIDPNTGKARLEVTVDEGPRYRLASFSIEGNQRFEDERLERFFRTEEGGLLRTLGLRGGGAGSGQEGEPFDAEAFNAAITGVQELYANEGYLYARVNPRIRRVEADNDGDPLVEAVWDIQEGGPAIVNRVSIAGNEYTHEWVLRDRILVLPGDVYSQDRVLRSYQNISGLGFFEAPLPPPDIQPLENGDVDITFNVVEKQTGSMNFGTSVGGGVGLSGFIGYEQPNLFGQAKSGTVRWDFGRYINSFETTYSDPALFQSRLSGTISLFNSRDRFFQFATGRRRRLGANLRVGVPWPGSRFTRVFVGYGISRTRYEQFDDVDDTSLFGRPPGVQSQFSLGITRQTLDSPLFPTAGSRQNITIETNGGILGGDGQFTRTLFETSWWTPVAQLGDASGGGRPIRFALGLSMKAGAVFGDAEAFPFERFWMGGVQFGEMLRGYDETTITPLGFFPERDSGISDIQRLGDAFLSISAEYALRLNDQVSFSAFYDAGNVWRDAGQIDPTQLFRGAGFGLQLVTPFGPIGLDYAYGFDKLTPGWQFHFRMGPGF